MKGCPIPSPPGPLNILLLPPTGPTASHPSPPAPRPFLCFQARRGPRLRPNAPPCQQWAVSTPSLHSVPPTQRMPSSVQGTRAKMKNVKVTWLPGPAGQGRRPEQRDSRPSPAHPLLRGCWRMSLSGTCRLSSQAGNPWVVPCLSCVESAPLGGVAMPWGHQPPSPTTWHRDRPGPPASLSQSLSRGLARSQGAPNGPSSNALNAEHFSVRRSLHRLSFSPSCPHLAYR